MVYRGHVRNGCIELDEPASLPEGANVRVEVGDHTEEGPLLGEHGETLGQKLLRHAGRATGLPPDAARNLDHYLYGTLKR
jgi:hypothetical protein